MVLIDHDEAINLWITLAAGAVGGTFGVALREGESKRSWKQSISLVGSGALIGSIFASGVEWKYPEANVVHIFVSASISLIVSRWGERRLLWLLDVAIERAKRVLVLWLATGERRSQLRIDENESDSRDADTPPDDQSPFL